MAFSIQDIRSKLSGGGARPSLFEVRVTFPTETEGSPLIPFMVKASSIPASTLTNIDVPYFGRVIKVAGTRVYDNWSVQVINDENFDVRKAMENWSRKINTYIGNVRDFATSAPNSYKGTADVIQYGKRGEAEKLATYKMQGIFPLVIGPIELSWENGSAIEEFAVEFAVDSWDRF